MTKSMKKLLLDVLSDAPEKKEDLTIKLPNGEVGILFDRITLIPVKEVTTGSWWQKTEKVNPHRFEVVFHNGHVETGRINLRQYINFALGDELSLTGIAGVYELKIECA
jgi:hypothetical protein